MRKRRRFAGLPAVLAGSILPLLDDSLLHILDFITFQGSALRHAKYCRRRCFARRRILRAHASTRLMLLPHAASTAAPLIAILPALDWPRPITHFLAGGRP